VGGEQRKSNMVSPPLFISKTDRPKKTGVIVSCFNALFSCDKVWILAKDDKRRCFSFNSDRDKELQGFFKIKNKVYLRIMWRLQ
jgi:hypothetical protein